MPHLPPQPPGLLSPTIPDLFATLRALRCQSNASSTRIWKVNSRFHSNVSPRKTVTATTLCIQANILGIPHHSPPLRCRCIPTGGTGGRCSGSKRSSVITPTAAA
ncbi:hypothetical protein CesoFtcFv8_009027 [Champsocephalus esox]|uniref:Uncharacterized protein n=1 Tax=Champsocephalus esox TaxID=159716 RepID=A0AAN8CDH5_9TELE|nr:hypothetical protein CesoFtcFv8_009027 [Champsocephalus esox]